MTLFMYKNEGKTTMYQIDKQQTLNYRFLTWDRRIHTESGGVKHVSGIPTLP